MKFSAAPLVTSPGDDDDDDDVALGLRRKGRRFLPTLPLPLGVVGFAMVECGTAFDSGDCLLRAAAAEDLRVF